MISAIRICSKCNYKILIKNDIPIERKCHRCHEGLLEIITKEVKKK